MYQPDIPTSSLGPLSQKNPPAGWQPSGGILLLVCNLCDSVGGAAYFRQDVLDVVGDGGALPAQFCGNVGLRPLLHNVPAGDQFVVPVERGFPDGGLQL